MANAKILPLLLATIVLGACAKSAPDEMSSAATAMAEPPPAPAKVERATASRITPLDKKKFGGEITEKTSTPLDTLLREPSRFATKTVRTEGKVSAVCEHAGCWMEIQDETGKAHIKMAGHSFSVPREVSGHHAVVQGKVLGGDKDHCTEEAEEQTGAVAKVQIEATGIEFVD